MQKVNVKISTKQAMDDGLELKFEHPDAPTSIVVPINREQALSLAKIIHAKYGDTE